MGLSVEGTFRHHRLLRRLPHGVYMSLVIFIFGALAKILPHQEKST